MVIKSVAIIGLGPAGAITIDALIKEGVFDRIEVFERKSAPGGCWYDLLPKKDQIHIQSKSS